MRYCVALAALAVWAQEAPRQDATYTYDLSGRRVPVSTVTTAGPRRVETVQSINGRAVPRETVEEKVISEGPQGRIVERTIRRYGLNGSPGAAEKVRIEERKNADGSSQVNTSLFESDLNGRFSLRERASTTTSQAGQLQRSETVVERADLNGGAQPVEKRISVMTGDEKQSQTDVTVLRLDTNGNFAEAARQLTQTSVEDGRTTTTTAEYNTAVTGQMEITGQTVVRSVKNPDGSETRVVDVYGGVVPGRPRESTAGGLVLREQQIIEQTVGPGGSVLETFSVRRPDLASGQLGKPQLVSETVCTGSCLPEKKEP